MLLTNQSSIFFLIQYLLFNFRLHTCALHDISNQKCHLLLGIFFLCRHHDQLVTSFSTNHIMTEWSYVRTSTLPSRVPVSDRPASSDVSPDKAVYSRKAYVSSQNPVLKTGRPPCSNRRYPVLCPVASRQQSHCGACRRVHVHTFLTS